MQRVADQATAAKSEASDALVKETALRSKLDLLCKEVRGLGFGSHTRRLGGGGLTHVVILIADVGSSSSKSGIWR